MKILISGPVKCGKSSYVKYLDSNALNVEAKGADEKLYTVAMDLGSVKLNGFWVYLFGTPGLLRFSVMRDIVSEGSDGLLFLFDSSAPEKDDDALIILNSIRKVLAPNAPILYLANKQDLENARDPEVIRAQNNLPDNAKIFPTSTVTGINIRESLKYLVNEIYNEYSSLIATLKNYESNIEGLANTLNKNKDEMRTFLNTLEIKKFIEIDRGNKTYKVRDGLKYIV